MKIIRPERILKYMDDHNWHSLTAPQIKQFVEELDLTEYPDFAEGYCHGLEVIVEKISKELEKSKKLRKLCESCRWWSEDVCYCAKAKYNNTIRLPYEYCDKWEE